jgi:hypothetical protein
MFSSAHDGFPQRKANLSEATPLVIVFAHEPDLLPFVRYLFNKHLIFTVADWDEASPTLLELFELSSDLRVKFKKKIGRPLRKNRQGDGHVTALRICHSPAP